MGRKRGNNEGTIYQRTDGRWCAELTVAGRRRSHYAATRRDVAAWLNTQRAAIQDGRDIEPSRVTVAEFLDRWLAIDGPNLAPSSRLTYAIIMRRHIVPHIGNVRLQSLRADHIQRLVVAQRESGAGLPSIELAHIILRRALNRACRWGLLAINPALHVDIPHPARREMQTFTADQVRVFVQACAGSRLAALFYLAVTTGLRQGELLGLQWGDVDWTTRALRIQRQLQHIAGEGYQLREPKTVRGRRHISLGETAIARLRAHRAEQLQERVFLGAEWANPWDLVFTAQRGGPLNSGSVRAEFHAICAAADLPRIRFHDLRHTAASLMLAQGVHPKVVQEMLGHSSISMTLDTYSHVSPGLARQAADVIENLLALR